MLAFVSSASNFTSDQHSDANSCAGIRETLPLLNFRCFFDNIGRSVLIPMSRFKLDVITAVAACVVAVPVAGNWLPELSHRQNIDLSRLAEKLSPTAKIYYPGSAAFDDASSRWSVLDQPRVNAVVVPGTENDVAETVILPFLHLPGTQGKTSGR